MYGCENGPGENENLEKVEILLTFSDISKHMRIDL